MKRRIAAVLGWTLEEVNQFAYPTLRELVRPIDPQLADDISRVIADGSYILEG